jgi:acetylornithine deacetylase/succinyl-diaminopimelate desuccinylase-like protein
MDAALAYLDSNRDRFQDLLFEYLRIPSISAVKESHAEARRAGEFVKAHLEEAGLEAGLYEGDGLPTVHGARIEDESKPTLLVYGHYDVQPAEPLELWETPPFEPTIVDGEIRARGCADDKGPSLALAIAVECLAKAGVPLATNVRFIIEGEEECGGPVVEQYLRANQDELSKAEAVVIADTCGLAKGKPALCYGLRGMVAAEITLTGPARDLHSGTYGGTIANPATALARLVASLHDTDGRVAVDGFYDGVLEVDAAERARVAAIPFDEAEYLAETGSPALFGEAGYSTLERKGSRPTCEINGIFGGYAGEGIKTIVPAHAGCKITCRLVPGQDPARVFEALQAHLERQCPSGVRLEVSAGFQAPAVYTDPETNWAKAARGAMEKAFGVPAALTREGGSIPVVNVFDSVLGTQPLLLGTYAPGEKAHSPNERYFVEDFFAAIRTGIHLFGSA